MNGTLSACFATLSSLMCRIKFHLLLFSVPGYLGRTLHSKCATGFFDYYLHRRGKCSGSVRLYQRTKTLWRKSLE